MENTTRPKCMYYVLNTEFWSARYAISAESADDAIVTYGLLRDLKALSPPRREMLGTIETAQVTNAAGKILIDNSPPGDDAERLLFIEMFQRMHAICGLDAIRAGVNFIAPLKKWDADQLWKEIRKES